MNLPSAEFGIKFSINFVADFADDNMSPNIGNKSKTGKYLPDCITLDKSNFENFILAVELFEIASWIFKTCALVNNNLCKVSYWVIWRYIKAKWIYNALAVPWEKYNAVSFASSTMKSVSFLAFSKFLVKLICCIALESTLSACSLIKSIAIDL